MGSLPFGPLGRTTFQRPVGHIYNGGRPETVQVVHTETVMRDGELMELRIEGEAQLVRGPIGRFIDLTDALAEARVPAGEVPVRLSGLAAQLRAEGLTVPPDIESALARGAELAEIRDVLARLGEQREGDSEWP